MISTRVNASVLVTTSCIAEVVCGIRLYSGQPGWFCEVQVLVRVRCFQVGADGRAARVCSSVVLAHGSACYVMVTQARMYLAARSHRLVVGVEK
jgi:hypothetical protein